MPKRLTDVDDVKAVVKKPRQKKRKILGESEVDIQNTDLKYVRSILFTMIKNLAKMVDDDWHDGYDRQCDLIMEFKECLKPVLLGVYHISIQSQKEFLRCNEIMKFIADCWDNLKSVPIRGGMVREFNNEYSEFELFDVNGDLIFTVIRYEEILQQVWTRFLVSAASCTSEEEKVSDELMFRFIKDADCYGVHVLGDPDWFNDRDDQESPEEDETAEAPPLSDGMKRLTELYEQRMSWQMLPSMRKRHRMRRAIDRRYEGVKEKRTRWFPEDEREEKEREEKERLTSLKADSSKNV